MLLKVKTMTAILLLLLHLFAPLSSAQTQRGQFNEYPFKAKRVSTVMSAATVAIFVGQSGAGKSTLINKILGVSQAKVSHSKLFDGTEKIQLYGGTVQTGFAKCCDTPELLTDEQKQGLYAYVRKGDIGKTLIVLVINKNVNRITNYVSEFEDLLTDLVPQKQKFAAVWVGRDDVLSLNDQSDFQKKFPQAQQFDIKRDNYGHLLVMLKDANSYCDPLCRPTNSVPASRPIKSKIAIPTSVDKIIPIGLPKLFNRANSFSTSAKLPPPRWQKVVKTVIEHKMNRQSTKYRTLKLMGDAYLKPLVYQHILRENKYVDDMEDKAHCVISNKADSAMPLFYDSHVRLLHDQMIPAEKGILSSHGKSDVVEAILEHCRLELETEALKFLISTLFESLK